MKLYRGKYLICICDNDEYETMRFVFNNTGEFAEFIGIKRNVATQILYSLFTHRTNFIVFNKKKYLVYFIKDN